MKFIFKLLGAFYLIVQVVLLCTTIKQRESETKTSLPSDIDSAFINLTTESKQLEEIKSCHIAPSFRIGISLYSVVYYHVIEVIKFYLIFTLGVFIMFE